MKGSTEAPCSEPGNCWGQQLGSVPVLQALQSNDFLSLCISRKLERQFSHMKACSN